MHIYIYIYICMYIYIYLLSIVYGHRSGPSNLLVALR